MGEVRRVDGAGARPSSRRWPRRLALLLLLVPLLLLALVDLRPGTVAGAARLDHVGQGSGALRVGAGKAPIDLPPKVVLAGYRPFGRRPGGPPTPIHVRSLVLEAEGFRTGILLLELMTLPASLADRIAALARAEGIDCSLRIASHTHSGPGGYDRALLPQAVAVGRFDPAVEEAILAAVSASLAAARSELGPATLRFEEHRIQLTRNRDRRGAPVDDRLDRLDFLRPDGRRVATVLRLASHPTLAPLAGGLSGDWPGALMAALEEEGGVALVLQGSVADARARRKVSPEDFAEGVVEALAAPAQPEAPEAPDAEGEGAPRALPAAAGASSSISLACAEGAIDLPAPDLRGMVPPPLSRLLSNATLPLAPASAGIAALRIERHLLLGLPLEATAQVGALLEERAGPGARVISLAQDYVGYAVLEADLEERVLSARGAWFGAALTPALLQGVATLAEAVRAPVPSQGEAAIAP